MEACLRVRDIVVTDCHLGVLYLYGSSTSDPASLSYLPGHLSVSACSVPVLHCWQQPLIIDEPEDFLSCSAPQLPTWRVLLRVGYPPPRRSITRPYRTIPARLEFQNTITACQKCTSFYPRFIPHLGICLNQAVITGFRSPIKGTKILPNLLPYWFSRRVEVHKYRK